MVLSHFVLCLVLAHRTQEKHVVLVFLNQFWFKTHTFRMVPFTLVLTLNVLFIVILPRAKTVDLGTSWRVDHERISRIDNFLIILEGRIHFSLLMITRIDRLSFLR
jgi:hypothetical protein